MPLAPGTQLGFYTIQAFIAEGGMGEVYRARDTKLQRDVALKTLPIGTGADPDRISRFEREARTLAALNHPHIAAIYGLEDTTGTPVLVMELVEGEDLAERLARGALPVADALTIAAQIADALDAAHERGIVHRDLKPANIKLRADGTVKVLDFGLARMFGPPEPGSRQESSSTGATLANSPTYAIPVALTSAGMILGTAAYMSPEQARGQAVDARTDLWAFGCVLFEMLTGTRTFAGDTVTDLLAAVVKEEPRWADLPHQTPGAIQRLLRRCLTKDRKRRLASAADARLDIEEASSPRGADAPPAVPPPKRSPLALGLVLAVVLAAIVGAYFLGRSASATPAPPAKSTRFVISAPPGTQIVSGHREVAVSADGQQIAFIARDATDQYIYVRRLDELTSRQIAGTEGARDLAFSPDGHWLAFHAGNRIRKVNLAGGAPAVLAEAAHAHGLAWHPTEDAIYFAPHQLSAIWKVPASGDSAAVAVTTLDAERGERSHEWPLFSADARLLIFTVNSNGANFDAETVSFLTLATNSRQTVRTGGPAFTLTDRGELQFLRMRSIMGAPYSDGRLGSSRLLESSIAVTSAAMAAASGGTLAYVPSPEISRRSLVWIAPDGGVTDAGFGQRAFGSISLSPDGRRAALSVGDGSENALYVAAASGGTSTVLTQTVAWSTAWSPDGKWIAGTIRVPNTSAETIARIAVEPGRAWEGLLPSAADEVIVSDWTPDGRGLLYSLRDSASGRRTVARLALDSTPPKVEIVVDSGKDRIAQLPSISPDGRWLAYESNELGRSEVYVQSYPTPTTRVQVSRDGGARAMWSRSGDSLYFVAGSALMISSITTHPELRADLPRVILNDPLVVQAGSAGSKPFAIAPDGRILAIKEDGSVRSDHIVVVENWLPQIPARQAGNR